MIDLGNRKIDEYGNVFFKSSEIYSLIMKGHDVLSFSFENDDELQTMINSCFDLDNHELSPKVYSRPNEELNEVIQKYKSSWNIPEDYKVLDVRKYILDKCKTKLEIQRVNDELDVFEKYELIDILRVLVYLIDTFKKNNIIWGVGRGSSVSSYVLFLIGIHRVDSLKYDLSFSEFLE